MNKILGFILLIVGLYVGYVFAFASDSSSLPLRSTIKGMTGILPWVVIIILIVFGVLILRTRNYQHA